MSINQYCSILERSSITNSQNDKTYLDWNRFDVLCFTRQMENIDDKWWENHDNVANIRIFFFIRSIFSSYNPIEVLSTIDALSLGLGEIIKFNNHPTN